MDPLSDTIALLKVEQLSWKELIARGSWAISFPQTSGVVFALVAEGACVLQREGEEALALQSGDFILLSRPTAWRLASSPDDAPRSPEVIQTQGGARLAQIGEGDGPATRVLGGHFRFDPGRTGLLDEIVPASLIVQGGATTASRLRRFLDLLGEEAAAERPSRDLVIGRLLELVLVETLRSDRLDKTGVGLLAGLADARLAKALAAIHRDSAGTWSVASLADEAGMSRSVFAEQFQRTLGLAPMAYVGRWRMVKAAQLLAEGRRRLPDIADRCGYGSASAFSTAFTRTFGRSPSAYRAEAARLN